MRRTCNAGRQLVLNAPSSLVQTMPARRRRRGSFDIGRVLVPNNPSALARRMRCLTPALSICLTNSSLSSTSQEGQCGIHALNRHRACFITVKRNC